MNFMGPWQCYDLFGIMYHRHAHSHNPFPKLALVFTCQLYKSFKNAAKKGESARNEKFPLLPQCFLPFSSTSK